MTPLKKSSMSPMSIEDDVDRSKEFRSLERMEHLQRRFPRPLLREMPELQQRENGADDDHGRRDEIQDRRDGHDDAPIL
ncbi:MAG TPA: hypothetical protein VFL12_02575 [Thermoanaerobaculia bacterium]|nr:hypothetical protein [Thermoanaerobaculia bacterium]